MGNFKEVISREFKFMLRVRNFEWGWHQTRSMLEKPTIGIISLFPKGTSSGVIVHWVTIETTTT